MSMTPDNTPAGIILNGNPTGIQRLSGIPVFVGIAVAAMVVTLLSYAIYERGKPITLQQEEEVKHRKADIMSPTKIASAHRGAEIRARYREEEERVIQTPPPPPEPATPKRRPEADVLNEQKLRHEAKRQQMKYGALDAPVDVDFKKQAHMSTKGTVADTPSDQRRRLYQAALEQSRADFNTPGISTGDQNMQDQKRDFLQTSIPKTPAIYGRDHPQTTAELRSGTVIPAVMITGINSDLPGLIKAQVSQNVYDTATGQYLMIPQGTMLVGTYDSKVSAGQSRALVVWSRLILPDGSAVELGNMPGNDMAGYAGLADSVDNHYLKVFGSALLMSVISAGYAIATEDDSNSVEQTVQNEVGQEMAQTSDRILRKNLSIQPTITIRPGYRFNVFVNKDIRFKTPAVVEGSGHRWPHQAMHINNRS